MANKKIKHIVAKLLGETTEETLDIYDESALHATDIVDNLTSTDATKVLSAKQGKALNDSITSNVANLQTRINGKSTVSFTKPTVAVANGQTMTKTAGEAYALVFDIGRILISFELAFKCTTSRASGDSVCRFNYNNADIVIGEPYQFLCFINNDGVARFSNRSESGIFICNPTAWNANTEFRVSGIFISYC